MSFKAPLLYPLFLVLWSLWRAKIEGLTLATMPAWLWAVIASEVITVYLILSFVFPQPSALAKGAANLRSILGLLCVVGIGNVAVHAPWYALRQGGIYDWSSTLAFLQSAGLAFLLSVVLFGVGFSILFGIVGLVRKLRPQR